MNNEKIAVSLPSPLAQRARRAVRQGRAASVSAYVAAPARVMAGLTLDSGALIAFERNDRTVVALLTRALEHHLAMAVPAAVIGLVWRDGRRQARLARLLGADEIEVEPLDDQRAREAGQLCGIRGTGDVVDASVVLCARRRKHRIVTSDVSDLAHLDPSIPLIRV